jgi:hypothetical protein
MAPSIVILLPAIVFCATVAAAQGTAPTNTRSEPVLDEFTTAVTRYVEVHRVLANPIADWMHGPGARRTARARRTYRPLIDQARAYAELPKVFTPRVSEYLRGQIRLALNGVPPDGEHWPLAIVLETLPRLPFEMSYRFDGLDLMLVDVEANLVVDVLEKALPRSANERPELAPEEMCAPEPLPLITGSPCDAHQELEMCWS